MLVRAYRWLDRNILELGREMRLSYLPPLMVYLAAGIRGLRGSSAPSSSKITSACRPPFSPLSVLGGDPMGAEDALGAPGGPDVAPQGAYGLPGRGHDRREPAHHARAAGGAGGHGPLHAGGGLVRPERPPGPRRLCGAGRGGGCHDGGGGAQGQRERGAYRCGAAAAHAHHHADSRTGCHHRRRGHCRASQRGPVPGRRWDVGCAEASHLHRDLPARARDPRRLRARGHPGRRPAATRYSATAPPGICGGGSPADDQRVRGADRAELVDPGGQPSVRGLHPDPRAGRRPLQPGDHLHRLDAHHPVPDGPAGAGAGARGSQGAGGHCHGYLHLPRHAYTRAQDRPGG